MNIFSRYLNQINLDIRTSNNGRWMDQKVTPDVLSLVAQTILDYSDTGKPEFSNRDLFQDADFLRTVSQFFNKPATSSKEMENEYNKFTGQQLKVLSYAKILNEDSHSRPFVYTILKPDLLELIAQSDKKALKFLQSYITKCLSDSEFDSVNTFLSLTNPSTDDFNSLKEDFIDFEITNTPINKVLEPRRILAKVLNPLSFDLQKKGAVKGHLSHTFINWQDLLYNSANPQDAGKNKSISRHQFRVETSTPMSVTYRIEKAINSVRRFNIKFNNGLSETGSSERGTQGHHMLPRGIEQNKAFAAFPENIIMISPNEHYLKAHVDNNTKTLNPEYQEFLLKRKVDNIIQAKIEHPDESPYEIDQLVEMVQFYTDNTSSKEVCTELSKELTLLK